MNTTTKTTTRKIPTPLYAAAGAGDFAYQQLRKLPEQVAQLRERVGELRPAVTEVVSEANLRADLDRLRDRAVAVYTDLVARGEKVVGNAKTDATLEITQANGVVKAEVTTSTQATPPDAKTGTPAKKTTAPRK